MDNSLWMESGSCRCHCWRSSDSALVRIDYSGLITPETVIAMSEKMREFGGDDVALICYQRAVICYLPVANAIKTKAYLSTSGFWVVREDQYDQALNHASMLASIGLCRSVFLESEMALCLSYAERAADSWRSRQQSRQTHQLAQSLGD